MTKNEPVNNQSDPELCEFILLEMPYRCKLILPIEEAIQIVKMMSRAEQVHSEYDKPDLIKPMSDFKFELKFMSQVDINTLKVKAGLQDK
jgi:hypothetical protein